MINELAKKDRFHYWNIHLLCKFLLQNADDKIGNRAILVNDLPDKIA